MPPNVHKQELCDDQSLTAFCSIRRMFSWLEMFDLLIRVQLILKRACLCHLEEPLRRMLTQTLKIILRKEPWSLRKGQKRVVLTWRKAFRADKYKSGHVEVCQSWRIQSWYYGKHASGIVATLHEIMIWNFIVYPTERGCYFVNAFASTSRALYSLVIVLVYNTTRARNVALGYKCRTKVSYKSIEHGKLSMK